MKQQRKLGKILLLGSLGVWVGTHAYIIYVGGLPESQAIAHAWINLGAFAAYLLAFKFTLNLK